MVPEMQNILYHQSLFLISWSFFFNWAKGSLLYINKSWRLTYFSCYYQCYWWEVIKSRFHVDFLSPCCIFLSLSITWHSVSPWWHHSESNSCTLYTHTHTHAHTHTHLVKSGVFITWFISQCAVSIALNWPQPGRFVYRSPLPPTHILHTHTHTHTHFISLNMLFCCSEQRFWHFSLVLSVSAPLHSGFFSLFSPQF